MSVTDEAGRRKRVVLLLETALRRFRHLTGGEVLARAAVVRRDAPSDMVTALGFAGRACPYLDGLSLPLSDLPGLDFGTQAGRFRVIHDIGRLGSVDGRHVQSLLQAGFRSSLTAALHGTHDVDGYLFVNATLPGYFTPERVAALTPCLTQTLVLLRRELIRS